MTTFELETTYLGLDGSGRVTSLPVGPDFWQTIGENVPAQGTLVTVGKGEGSWKHWEVHPHGDEVLIVLEGSVRMIFQKPSGEETFDLSPGRTLIVPAGVWHRAENQVNLRMLFMTFGKDTKHKPL
jgi:mannose-6-phosphate isomerase-like protein (cupin superfamily)